MSRVERADLFCNSLNQNDIDGVLAKCRQDKAIGIVRKDELKIKILDYFDFHFGHVAEPFELVIYCNAASIVELCPALDELREEGEIEYITAEFSDKYGGCILKYQKKTR